MQKLWRKRGDGRDDISALNVQSVSVQSQADRSITRVIEVTIEHEPIAEGQFEGRNSTSGYIARNWDPVAEEKKEKPSPYQYRAFVSSGDPGKSFATSVESATCQRQESANKSASALSAQSNKSHWSAVLSGLKTWRRLRGR
jgi:hypothetical protein